MAATRQDTSGIFDADLVSPAPRIAATLDAGFELTAKGITFVSNEYLPEWTEIGVELRLPDGDQPPHQNEPIDCRGVVVQCARCTSGPGFDVTLMFLDLPKSAQARLAAPTVGDWPATISISR